MRRPALCVESTPNDYRQSGQEHLEIWMGNSIWKNASKYLGTIENWQGFELAKLIKLFLKCLGSTNYAEFAKHLFLQNLDPLFVSAKT